MSISPDDFFEEFVGDGKTFGKKEEMPDMSEDVDKIEHVLKQERNMELDFEKINSIPNSEKESSKSSNYQTSTKASTGYQQSQTQQKTQSSYSSSPYQPYMYTPYKSQAQVQTIVTKKDYSKEAEEEGQTSSKAVCLIAGKISCGETVKTSNCDDIFKIMKRHEINEKFKRDISIDKRIEIKSRTNISILGILKDILGEVFISIKKESEDNR